ncbi:hypothetical protein JCM21900_001665 [Sporobolomyces salmonicolor]
MSRVGEGLFNLPRMSAIYADDDALAFSIETLPSPPGTALSSNSSMNRPHCGSSFSLSSAPPLTPLSAETGIATWLPSLMLTTPPHLTSVILPAIARFSKHGARPLVSDLDYISNVARALDVESPDVLEARRDAVAMEDKTARACRSSAGSIEGSG